MDGEIIGVIALIVVNIAAVAYSYGSLRQEVKDITRRVDRIEKSVNGTGKRRDE